jgi:hypothetical protein
MPAVLCVSRTFSAWIASGVEQAFMPAVLCYYLLGFSTEVFLGFTDNCETGRDRKSRRRTGPVQLASCLPKQSATIKSSAARRHGRSLPVLCSPVLAGYRQDAASADDQLETIAF